MSVVGLQDFVVQLHHFHAGDAQPLLLETADDFATELALNGAWFKQNECPFHWILVQR
jgi:hypothetical protein